MATTDMYKIRTLLSAGRRSSNNEIFIRKPTTVCPAEVKYLFIFSYFLKQYDIKR